MPPTAKPESIDQEPVQALQQPDLLSHSTAFDRAKKFSDFLAFHVRFFFVITLVQFAFSIPISSMIKSWNDGTAYDPSRFLLEFITIVFFLSYSIVMLYYIFETAFEFIDSKLKIFFFRIVAKITFFSLSLSGIALILYYSTTQILRLFGVSIEEAVCATNAFLSDTNYAFTPEKPDYCL